MEINKDIIDGKETTIYQNGDTQVAVAMNKSKNGKDYPTVSVFHTYVDYETGEVKKTAGWYPSDIDALLDMLPKVKEDFGKFIFKKK